MMSAAAPSSSGRPMRYPYTLTAKIVQFPWKFHINNAWIYKYWLMAMGVCFPVFWKLQTLSNTPENVQKWREIRKRDFSGHHH